MKVKSIKQHLNKFVRMRFLAKGEMSYITGTITELNGDYLWLNVNDDDEERKRTKVFYKNILRIFELNPKQMMFNTLQKKAEQQTKKGHYDKSIKTYQEMLLIATGKHQKKICDEMISKLNQKLIEVKC